MSNEEKKKNVLIVDDEEDMIWSLQKNLPNENLPVSITTASSGEEALSVLETTDIDLIVTDIKMPGMSGIDLLIAVRNSYPGIGVIVMTAFPSSESKAEVIEKGGLRFIEKPFDIKEMREFIRSALNIVPPLYEGKRLGIQLIDIVQVNNLAKSSNALRIQADGQEGVIYFSDGDIVHATCDDLVGEEAFYKLMSWQGGKIDTFYPDNYQESTISTPVGTLILKGVLFSQEMGREVDYLEELDLEQPEIEQAYHRKIEDVAEREEENGFPAILSEPDEESNEEPGLEFDAESDHEPDLKPELEADLENEQESELEPDSENEQDLKTELEAAFESEQESELEADPDTESELVTDPILEDKAEMAPDSISENIYLTKINTEFKEEEMEELKELLAEFTNIPGVNTACLVGRDGFLLHSVALAGVDSEMIGAIASSGFGASEAMGKQLEKGAMSMTMVEYENGPVMLAPVGREAFLVIVADKDANLGMIRLKIKKHSRDLEQKAGI